MKPGTPLPWAWKVPKPWDAKDTPHRRLYDARGDEVLREWADFADDAGIDVSDQNAAYIVTAANLHPRLFEALRSTVRQLEAVTEDVPGWMQRTMLCRRARELAKEAGETWAMGNGETLDSAKPTGALFPVPLNLGDSTIIAPEVWEEHLGEKIPVKKTTGEVVGWAVVERNPWGGFQWQVTFHPKPAPGSGGDDQ